MTHEDERETEPGSPGAERETVGDPGSGDGSGVDGTRSDEGDEGPREDGEGWDPSGEGHDPDGASRGGESGHRREEHWVAGDKVVSKVKELIHEGNVRRIIIRNEEGRTLIEVPLALGVGVAVLIPVWAAIGAVAAVVTRCSIIVERDDG